MIIETTSQA